MFRFAWICLVLFGYGLISVPSVQAYIPPSQFILKTWANKHNGPKSIRIKSVVSAVEGNKPTEVHFKETLIYYPELQVLRSWATDDSDRKLYHAERKISSASAMAKLLMSSDWQELTRLLKERGIPIKTEQEVLTLRTEEDRLRSEDSAFMRWNGGVAWAIGKTIEKEAQNPQLWFEKDTFLPVRWVYTGSNDSSLYEARFEGYRFSREFPYPRSVNLLRKGETILNIQLSELVADADRATAGGGPQGFTDAGNSASSSVRDLIRLYYEQFR